MKDNSQKIILSLCGGTGAWEDPYRKAGYDVRLITLPDIDVRKYKPPAGVYGILAAPPCTMFSQARTRASTPRDLREGMIVVRACLEIVWECRSQITYLKDGALRFWALENPKGFLQYFLGQPRLEFDPCDFGDAYTKRTHIWGHFNIPKKSPVAIPESLKQKFSLNIRDLPKLPPQRNPLFNPNDFSMTEREPRIAQRAITPAGFANAFFKENQ